MTPDPKRVVYHGRVDHTGSAHFGAHYFRAPGSTHPMSRRRQDIEAWCVEHLGPGREFVHRAERPPLITKRGRWWRTGSTWVIYADDDALAFRLRWC